MDKGLERGFSVSRPLELLRKEGLEHVFAVLELENDMIL